MANWFIRKGGSNNNGGSSASLTPDRSGTDMVTNSTSTVTSATAAFTAGDVGKGINISGVVYRIATYNSATSITLDRTQGTTGSARVWAIGGALLTVAKVTNASGATVFQAGDNVYVGAGVYREIPTIGQSYSGSQLNMIGDVDGVRTGDVGEVQITAYLTNDKTAPSATCLLDFVSGPRNNWSFSNFVFVSGSGNPRMLNIGNATNLTFTNCTFLSMFPNNVNTCTLTASTAAARNHLFDRCRFWMGGGFGVTFPTSATADYDIGMVWRNCIINAHGAVAFDLTSSGAAAFKGGGLAVYNCLVISTASPMIRTNTANSSTTFPVKIENSILIGAHNGSGLSANVLGQITEQYNILNVNTPRTNVAVGTGSVSDGSYALLFSVGQENVWGANYRPFGMPTAGSPLLGFGSSGNGPATDITGQPRPAGGLSPLFSVGPYERHNTFTKETAVTQSGSNAISITGPGCQDFMVPVNPATTTVSVYLRYDSTYTGTRPYLIVCDGTECGVADQVVTATTAALNGWDLVSVVFTPTTAGIVTIRIASNDTHGGGKVYADTFAVAT